MNKRINNFEFRHSENNKSYELIRWFQRKDAPEYCIVIAFLKKDKEGYYMETVGSRYNDALVEIDGCGGSCNELILLSNYAFETLMAEWKFEETKKGYFGE